MIKDILMAFFLTFIICFCCCGAIVVMAYAIKVLGLTPQFCG